MDRRFYAAIAFLVAGWTIYPALWSRLGSPFGGEIIGYNQLDGVWAVHVPDGKIITEPKPKGPHYNLLVGWQDDTHYITYDSKDTSGVVLSCAYFNLH